MKRMYNFRPHYEICHIQYINENLFLIAIDRYIRILKGTKYICSLYKNLSNNSKICKINNELFVILNKICCCCYCYFDYDNYFGELDFLKIEYNSEKNPIKMEIIHFPNLGDLTDINVIDENNIITIDANKAIYLFNINSSNKQYNIKKKIDLKNYNLKNKDFDYYSTLIDKINSQIVIYTEQVLDLYELNESFIPKKQLYIKFNKIGYGYINFSILKKFVNKELYIYYYYQSIYLISSKYFEIICNININIEIKNIYIVDNLNNIIICDIYNKFLLKYKFINNQLKFQNKKHLKGRKIYDIKQNEDNGNYLIFTDCECINFQQRKFKIFIIKNENDLKDKKIYSNKYDNNDDNNYSDDEFNEFNENFKYEINYNKIIPIQKKSKYKMKKNYLKIHKNRNRAKYK